MNLLPINRPIIVATGLLFLGSACSRPVPGPAPEGGTAEPTRQAPADKAAARSWPMLGGSPSRNAVNTVDKMVPTEWSVKEGEHKNIKWISEIGDRGYGCPIIAEGRIFVSTNNVKPRDPKVKGHRAVIMCFAEKDGKFLWQTAHDMAPPEVDQQAKYDGMCSTPTVDGERLYFVTPGCKVVCVQVENGQTAWSYDLMKELKVYPCIINACAPLVVGDLVFVMTANGVDEQGKVPAPEAPSFVALNKKDGTLKWQSNLPGANIIHGQWGNPVHAKVNGKAQVIFPGGDGYLYGLDAADGKMIWKFQCSPTKEGGKALGPKKRNSYVLSTPVVHDNKVYVGIGAAPDTGYGNRIGHFWCVDITKSGDISPVDNNYDAKAPANKDSGLVWHFGGPTPEGSDRDCFFGQTLSTCVVHDGLVYAADMEGYFYCLDAKTGQKYWDHDLKGTIWGSPSWIDGKVYIGSQDGDVHILAHGKQKKLLGKIEMDQAINSAAVAASGVLYITTMRQLFAIASK